MKDTPPREAAALEIRNRFFAPIERYQLVGLLLRYLRLSIPGASTGTALAKLADVSSGTWSNAEHLDAAVAEPKRRVGRDQLLKILFDGLRLEASHASALLWIYDGLPLSQREHEHFVSRTKRLPAFDPSVHYPRLLSNVCGKLRASKQPGPSATFVFTHDPVDNPIDEEEQLLALDQGKGPRILASNYPTGLAMSVKDAVVGETKRARRLLKQRIALYSKQIELYSERSIHCDRCLDAFLSPEDYNGLDPWSRRQRHIRRWKSFLEKYRDRYYVAMASQTPEQDFIMKLGVGTMLRGKPHPKHGDSKGARLGSAHETNQRWGPRFCWSSDSGVQLMVLNAFEKKWFGLPLESRTDNDWGYKKLMDRLTNALKKKG